VIEEIIIADRAKVKGEMNVFHLSFSKLLNGSLPEIIIQSLFMDGNERNISKNKIKFT
jgi:hypothetical protein